MSKFIKLNPTTAILLALILSLALAACATPPTVISSGGGGGQVFIPTPTPQMASISELEALKKIVEALNKRINDLEVRIAALETTKTTAQATASPAVPTAASTGPAPATPASSGTPVVTTLLTPSVSVTTTVSYTSSLPIWTGGKLYTYSDQTLVSILGIYDYPNGVNVTREVALANDVALEIGSGKWVSAKFVCRPDSVLKVGQKNPEGCPGTPVPTLKPPKQDISLGPLTIYKPGSYAMTFNNTVGLISIYINGTNVMTDAKPNEKGEVDVSYNFPYCDYIGSHALVVEDKIGNKIVEKQYFQIYAPPAACPTPTPTQPPK
ncbi:MAG: hypothetical protein AAB557_03575 [Patescibacteria group bacterium]